MKKVAKGIVLLSILFAIPVEPLLGGAADSSTQSAVSPAQSAVSPAQSAVTSATAIEGPAVAYPSQDDDDPSNPDVVQVSEGVTTLGAAEWHDAGITGTGARLAIVDTGFALWSEAAAKGRVHPAPVLDLDYCNLGFERSSHGTATGEIIWDLAPTADVIRVCIDDAADLAIAVDRLILEDVHIVNMSLGFFNSGPGDGKGPPGSPDASVRKAIAAGITWVNSAGNESDVHHRAVFRDADGNGRHEFPDGAEAMVFWLPPMRKVDLYLKWNDWTNPTNDLQVCLSDEPGRTPSCFASQLARRGTPTQAIGLTNPFDRPSPIYLQLRRVAGAQPVDFDLFFVGAERIDHPVAAGSMPEPAAVPGVVSVGAICNDTGLVRPSSSQGPTLDGRSGITLVAAGAVSSVVYGAAGPCAGGYEGSSASAAHVAGAVALVRDVYGPTSGMSPVDVLVELAIAAGDPGSPGIDSVYGAGLLTLGEPPVRVSDGQGPGRNTAGLGLAYSALADRSAPQPLAGARLTGDVRVFVTPVWPSAPVERVDWRIDGRLVQVERLAGFDLGGGNASTAYPFDSWRVGDGRRRISADVWLQDGSKISLTETVTIANGGGPAPAPTYRIDVSGQGRLARPLENAVVNGTVDLGLSGGGPGEVAGGSPGEVTVLYYVDAVLVGASDRVPSTVSVDMSAFGIGEHMSQVIVYRRDGNVRTANATFRVEPADPA